MKKLLSYLWPFTKEIPSKINGTLELTWMNGKKVLDSQNTNYSYGSLQKILGYGLSQIDIPATGTILLLGLGGGSIIQSLKEKFHHQGKIIAVEIDEIIIQIANNEFGVAPNPNLEIICEDALHYVNKCTQQFEIIIVDIFIDNTVPESFYGLAFWQKLKLLVKDKGHIVFNAGIHLQQDPKIKALLSATEPDLEFIKYNHVLQTNTLIIAQKKQNHIT